MIKVILFDLDGTLLPMDQEIFVKTYFGLIAQKLAPYGYQPKELIEAVWAGTKAMVKNDGRKTNEEVFWVLTVRNPAGNAAALTITPLAGGTRPVSAHLVITQIN